MAAELEGKSARVHLTDHLQTRAVRSTIPIVFSFNFFKGCGVLVASISLNVCSASHPVAYLHSPGHGAPGMLVATWCADPLYLVTPPFSFSSSIFLFLLHLLLLLLFLLPNGGDGSPPLGEQEMIHPKFPLLV